MKKNICAVVFVLLVAASVSATEKPQPLRVGDRLPSRTLAAFAGQAVTIPDDIRGNVTVVHFWTDSCGSCREEMPALDRLLNQYRQKGLQVVAINVGQPRSRVKKFLDSVKVTYPVLLDPEKESQAWYSVIGLPRTYILDRKGIVRYKLIGEASEETLRKYLSEVF